MEYILLLVACLHYADGGIHSLQYFNTAPSGLHDFPEFVTLGIVDGQPFTYYDSNIRRETPRQEWMANSVEEDYWEQQTQVSIETEQLFMNHIFVVKDRFNQTGGVHTFQQMYGCEWDDQTGAKSGFRDLAYDGEDFMTLNFKEMRWISQVQQGLISTQRWNEDKASIEIERNYFGIECIEWLQKYLKYGKSSLEKTVSPQVSLLQKSSSSPVVCHVTGFYPSRITISWQKNGQDHDEDVDLGELLPNADGTFQRTSTLTVTPEEWKNNKFRCVVEHQGKTRAADEKILTNDDSLPFGLIVGVVAALLLLVVISVAGYMVYHKKKGFKTVSGSDDGSNSSAHAVPQA